MSNGHDSTKWLNIMKQHLKGVAKCLTVSLVAAALTGCAIYEPYPGTYGGYDPYPYGQPVYSGVPYYVGPPISLGLWFEGRSGGGGHHWGGHHGGWGGRHR
jgi:hypothetical protein